MSQFEKSYHGYDGVLLIISRMHAQLGSKIMCGHFNIHDCSDTKSKLQRYMLIKITNKDRESKIPCNKFCI